MALAQVDKGVKTLIRKIIQGKVNAEWKAREYFVRPAQQRVLDAKESQRRLAHKRFKAVMQVIRARQARCAALCMCCMRPDFCSMNSIGLRHLADMQGLLRKWRLLWSKGQGVACQSSAYTCSQFTL